MTQQANSNDRATNGRTDDRTTSGAGAAGGGRSTHATNQRVDQLRGGLEKAVTGREHLIKSQALRLAERLDERTQGRHHNKIHVALRVVELIVDNVSGNRPPADERARSSDSTRGTGGARAGGDGAEHLGEFRNLNDEPRR